MLALERLEAAGIIRSCVRATRHLHPTGAPATSPLSDEEKACATDFRRQAAKELKLAKILLAEDLAEEGGEALRDSVRLIGCAFAVEERMTEKPATLIAALAPPLSYRWGEAVAKLRALAENTVVAPTEIVTALSEVMAKAGP